jgi:spore germination protein D
MSRVLRFISLAAVVLLASCGTDGSSGGRGQSASSYKDTKSMVMDILKSDEGRKAVQSAAFGLDEGAGGGAGGGSSGGAGGGMSGSTGIKTLAAGDAKQLQLAVKDVLTDQQNSAFLQNLLKDPKFAGDFAKAIQKENKQLMKDLMKDPEYQKLHLDSMKNPEYQKIVLDTMRGMQYRQYVMSIIQESMQSPLFKTEMINMLKKAIEEGAAAQAPSAGGGKDGKTGGGGGGGGGSSGSSSSKERSGDSGDSGDSSDDDSSDDQDKKKSKRTGGGSSS